VGLYVRDVSGGQHRTVGPAAMRGCCTGLKTWLRVRRRKTHSPKPTSSSESRQGSSASTVI
jgi:hypothetical protein